MRKVLVGGVWDIIHPGHIWLLSEARKLGEVIVIVARDRTVERLKGRRPIIPEDQRLEVIKNLKQVDEAKLGYEEDMFKVVMEVKPDIIMLGPDQFFNEDELRTELGRRGLKVEVTRVKETYSKFKLCSTSQIVDEILKRNLCRK